MSQQTFKKWEPGVWAARNTGLCTLEEKEEDERGQANQIQKGMPSKVWRNSILYHMPM